MTDRIEQIAEKAHDQWSSTPWELLRGSWSHAAWRRAAEIAVAHHDLDPCVLAEKMRIAWTGKEPTCALDQLSEYLQGLWANAAKAAVKCIGATA